MSWPNRIRQPGEGVDPHTLRLHWRAASVAVGWPFPSDWALPEIDQVCRAVVDQQGLTDALFLLGKCRASHGVNLAEAIRDLAALHAVTQDTELAKYPELIEVDAVPAQLVRALCLGWAEEMTTMLALTEAVDQLTGLSTSSYLRTRLREIYQASTVDGSAVSETHTLVLCRVTASRAQGWSRTLAMVLLADALRLVFNRGETLATLGPSVAVVLTQRDQELPLKLVTARWFAQQKLAVDPDLRDAVSLQFHLKALPVDHLASYDLLTDLAHQ